MMRRYLSSLSRSDSVMRSASANARVLAVAMARISKVSSTAISRPTHSTQCGLR